MSPQKLVLFVCWENSFRSQMAEAFFNAMAPPNWKAISAGIEPAQSVHPKAVTLMREEGIDIADKEPKALTSEMQRAAEIGVVVCGESKAGKCPVIYTKKAYYWGIPDPSGLSLEEARKVRDEIKKNVIKLIEVIRSSYLEEPQIP